MQNCVCMPEPDTGQSPCCQPMLAMDHRPSASNAFSHPVRQHFAALIGLAR